MSATDISQASLLELFRRESEEQLQRLSNGLLALEREPGAAQHLESCMRAAHSLKGAARVVGIESCVRLAHAMEDLFVAAQRTELVLHGGHINSLLQGLDLMRQISQATERDLDPWESDAEGSIGNCVNALRLALAGRNGEPRTRAGDALAGMQASQALTDTDGAVNGAGGTDRVVRVTAERLNRLLGFAGESLVESRRLQPLVGSLVHLKRLQADVCARLGKIGEMLAVARAGDQVLAELTGARHRAEECHRVFSERLTDFETIDGRTVMLSQRLYEEALTCRMRPFSDGLGAFPRMVRDLAHNLQKQVRLTIGGEDTQVDRDILEKLDAPLGHLLRNAVDHGIESPEERLKAGKAPEGTLHLEARQRSGRLFVSVRDDGRGIDLEQVRARVVQRSLATADTVARFSDTELFDFLLLPGFTLTDEVTEISGRGVGLDVVHHMLKEVRGTLRISSQRGHGTLFQLQLPLTLSVLRALLVEVAGEPYAIPLANIVRTTKLAPEAVVHLEGRPHFDLDGRRVGIAAAHQVLECGEPARSALELPVIVLGDEARAYGLVVDRLLGERELVVHLLEPRLGKIKDVAAASLMEDGSPVLILDVEDVIRSIERLVATDGLSAFARGSGPGASERRKRILIVEDSLTVRELERKVFANAGYEVEVAVDGMDGWNAVRAGKFDLVVTDIDMPRMDGIELVRLMRQDARAKSLPVMIVSYKDRPEDRSRGLAAGADYYLAKGNFHDDSLVEAASELIGQALA